MLQDYKYLVNFPHLKQSSEAPRYFMPTIHNLYFDLTHKIEDIYL